MQAPKPPRRPRICRQDGVFVYSILTGDTTSLDGFVRSVDQMLNAVVTVWNNVDERNLLSFRRRRNQPQSALAVTADRQTSPQCAAYTASQDTRLVVITSTNINRSSKVSSWLTPNDVCFSVGYVEPITMAEICNSPQLYCNTTL